MNERILRLRKYLKLSRAAFGKDLGVSGDVINNMERGRVPVKEPIIKLICSCYDVDENWLRNGEGEMFVKKDPEPLDELLSGLLDGENVTDEDRVLIKNFLELSDDSRKAVIEFVQRCADELSAPPPPASDAGVAAKLAELERQNKEIIAQNQALAAEIAAIREEDAEREKAEPVSASITLSQFR